MPTLVDKRNAAGDRYLAAVIEMRDAFVHLSALDRVCNAPSFGTPPEVVPLRHPTFLPALAGSFTDGVAEQITSLTK